MTELALALHERADRADRFAADPDLDRLVDDAMTEGRHLVRRRRVLAAATSGAVVIGAAAAVVVVLTPAPARDRIEPAGPLPVPTTTFAPITSTMLATAPATPKGAPVSLGLLPSGWTLRKYTPAYATWTIPGKWPEKYLEPLTGTLNVVVQDSNGKHLRTKDFPLRVANRPATYETTGGNQFVSLYINPSTTIDFDIPVTAHLSRDQTLQLAASLTIRNIDNPAHG